MKEKTKDWIYAGSKGLAGMLPGLGPLVSEIFSMVIMPPLQRRRTKWMNDITERLMELEAHNKIEFGDLAKNEQFTDIILEATSVALKTSQQEKIEALRNAVLNTAIGVAPDETISKIFLNQLDRFTVWHIKILDLIADPKKWYETRSGNAPNQLTGSTKSLLFDAFPELKDRQELLQVIWADLKNAGFHTSSDLGGMMTWDGVMQSRTTDFGNQFLKFISEQETSS